MSDYTARRIEGMETFYMGLFRRARSEIGASAFGLAVIELPAGKDNHPDHDHPDQEEVYAVLAGTGTLEIDGEPAVELTPEVIVRVGPNTRRRIRPGPNGMRLLCVGGVPGAAYAAPSYSELGAPDPLAE